MASPVGGSVESISINNRLFPVAADSDPTRDLGGFTVEYQSNGDGGARRIKTRKPWMLEGLTVVIDENRGDLEFLQENADGNDDVPITITLANGFTYAGVGGVTGDIKASSQSTTAEITLSGPQNLEVQ